MGADRDMRSICCRRNQAEATDGHPRNTRHVHRGSFWHAVLDGCVSNGFERKPSVLAGPPYRQAFLIRGVVQHPNGHAGFDLLQSLVDGSELPAAILCHGQHVGVRGRLNLPWRGAVGSLRDGQTGLLTALVIVEQTRQGNGQRYDARD